MSSQTQSLVVIGDIDKLIESIAPSGDALQKKSKALALAKQIVAQPENDAENQTALNAAAGVKGFLNELDEEKKRAKDPFDKAGKKILKVIKELTEEPEAEYKRITGLVGNYQLALQVKIDAERRALEIERARVEQERLRVEAEARKLREDAEKARIAAEQATTAAAKKKAAAELERIKAAEVEQEFAAAEVKEAQAEVENTVIEDAKLKGGAGRSDYDIELTDAAAFFSVHPNFCKVELIKTPLKAWLDVHWDGKSEISGIKVTKKYTIAVKGVATALALK